MTRLFLRITAHEAIEAAMSKAITPCTMGLASSIKVQIDRSLPISPLHKQILGNAARFQRHGIETGNARTGVDQLLVAASNSLFERNCRTAQLLQCRSDENFIIEHRRPQEIHRH